MAKTGLPKVAYFSMEYGLENHIRTYAGGLGILAGDYLKGARDHHFPIVGVGILWKQGYTSQMFTPEGRPFDGYISNRYDEMEDTGVIVPVTIRQRKVFCRVWKYDKKTVPLYLLDTDLEENEGADRWITGQLYGWFGEERIAQEMVLGIAGVRALRELGLDVDVYHFNEGHAVFAGFELIREKQAGGLNFSQALKASRKEIVFTTHTPVVQGNESHPLDRMFYMGCNNGLTIEQMVYLGGAPFNMTVAALRLSRKSNAVAALHNLTANKMWEQVERRSRIVGITNAIHIPTWVDPAVLKAAEGKGDLWETHMRNKQRLIAYVKEKTAVELDPEVLLIGFSRRIVPYKRNTLLFTNKKIIEPLLKQKKLAVVFSGKSHPLDEQGKQMIREVMMITRKYQGAVVFLPDYDMKIGKLLTNGADIWLNNPRRPQEASGTSGMKAAMNGVLNLSVLDGWWPEACDHGKNGWQFGDGFESDNIKAQDKHDSQALYRVLLDEVLPTYYEDRKKWVAMMKQSIRGTQKKFGIKRMLDEYYGKLYRA